MTDTTRYLIARPASDHTEYLRTFVREGRVIVADWIDTKPYAYGFRTLEEATELARALGGECSVLASERGRWVRVFP